jgi:hypothetical protein
VACLLRARIVQAEKGTLLGNVTGNALIARQCLSSRHVAAATDKRAITEEFGKGVLSVVRAEAL